LLVSIFISVFGVSSLRVIAQIRACPAW
jgi:hypothetical protein